jgi:outer membrane lipoprotein carrier protein
MKNWIKIFSFFSALLMVNPVLAQTVDYTPVETSKTQTIIEYIAKASASVTSLQCSFNQKKIISILSESVISKGKLLYKKENKLCWEYSSPYFYLFALNGDKVYIKNEKTSNQFDTKSNTLFKEISQLLVNSINGVGLIDYKKFDVVFFENKTSIKMQLAPKNKTLKSIMSSIVLYFEKSTYLVHNIEMVEPSGDSTTIVFNDVILNQPINDEKFVVH